MNEPIVITFEVSVLGLIVSTVALITLGMVIYYYRMTWRAIREIRLRLEVPFVGVPATLQHLWMTEMAKHPENSPRRKAYVRRLRTAGVDI